jgi:hypothetical protein
VGEGDPASRASRTRRSSRPTPRGRWSAASWPS